MSSEDPQVFLATSASTMLSRNNAEEVNVAMPNIDFYYSCFYPPHNMPEKWGMNKRGAEKDSGKSKKI